MAKHSQHQQGNSAGKGSGAGQAVVELCAVSHCGLIFWSRQRFDIGSELQIRVKSEAIPALNSKATSGEEWVTLRGFVVQCPAVRRPGGEHGFEVSLVLDSALMAPPPRRSKRPLGCPKMKKVFPGLKRVGLN